MCYLFQYSDALKISLYNKRNMERGESGSECPNTMKDSMDSSLFSVNPSGEEAEVRKGYYTLPTYRFTTLVQTVLLFDLVSSLALWLCGGDNNYMEGSVENFQIRDSVFDLAAIAFVKSSILFFVYPWLEHLSMKQIDHPYDKGLSSRKCFCHFLAIFLSVGSLAYSTTKGVLIYKVRSEKEHKLHPTYYALAISSLVFSFLESVVSLSSFVAMRRLKVLRILHTPNDADSNKKRKVNLGRLMTLAKPVSSTVFYSLHFRFTSQWRAHILYIDHYRVDQRKLICMLIGLKSPFCKWIETQN